MNSSEWGEKTNLKEKEILIYYAALLHDIGKFFWRKFKRKEFNHAELSGKFVEGIKEAQLGRFKWISDKEIPVLKRLVELHHDEYIQKAEKEQGESKEIIELAKIISYADTLSSKERIKEEDKEQEENLVSIFSFINLNGHPGNTGSYYFKFKPLSLDEIIFPEESPDKSGFNSLIDSFLTEYDKLLTKSSQTFKDLMLLSLLQKYLWCVPAAYYMTRRDISLFEHLKNTAAIAAAAFKEYIKGNNVFDKTKAHWLLIGGDISGIQNFIYNITSTKRYAKALKGRSFYIELLQRAVAKYIIEKLNLFEANILYLGGGKFYILSNYSAKDSLREIEEAVNLFLIEKFEGKLYFALAGEPIQASDFENIRGVFLRLIEKLNEKKNKKFDVLLRKHYEKFFEPVGRGAKPEICKMCGRELREEEIGRLETDEEQRCSDCILMSNIGKYLKGANYILELINYKADSSDERYVKFKFKDFEIAYRILEEKPYIKSDIEKSEKATIFLLNSTSLDKSDVLEALKDKKIDAGFTFTGGTGIEENKTFEDMAKESKGDKKLGVFRADVDNLGRIFSSGLGEEASISRLSQLSFLLKLFFCGYVNSIFKEDTYIIYSGGDDLFVVGAWDKVLEGALELNENFEKFVKNPQITLSGGFIYTNPKFPIYSFAELAGEAEEQAKNEGKNRLTIFSISVKWEDMKILKKIKDELLEAIENNILPRRYLHFLMSLAQFAKGEKKELSLANSINRVLRSLRLYRWRWLIPYYHARMRQRYKRAISLIDKIQSFIFNNRWEELKLSEQDTSPVLVYIPARWVELQTRKEGKE